MGHQCPLGVKGLHMLVFTHLKVPFISLVKSSQIMHISLDLFYAKRSLKTSCLYSLQRKCNQFVFFDSLIIYGTDI